MQADLSGAPRDRSIKTIGRPRCHPQCGRNGLITVPRNSYNNYRLFGKNEIERLRIIRMLGKAGYSHMAILRMFIELDKGNTRELKKVLDTPREDKDIFTAADRWLTTLHEQKKLAQQVIQLIEEIIESKQVAVGECQ
jgi:DNA-binding transcriptional MerR regulator